MYVDEARSCNFELAREIFHSCLTNDELCEFARVLAQPLGSSHCPVGLIVAEPGFRGGLYCGLSAVGACGLESGGKSLSEQMADVHDGWLLIVC